jgi:hypothetical protein
MKDNLVADHLLIAAKIRKENHPEFKLTDDTTPGGLGNLWSQLEKAESERASALAAEQIRIGGQGCFHFSFSFSFSFSHPCCGCLNLQVLFLSFFFLFFYLFRTHQIASRQRRILGEVAGYCSRKRSSSQDEGHERLLQISRG